MLLNVTGMQIIRWVFGRLIGYWKKFEKNVVLVLLHEYK